MGGDKDEEGALGPSLPPQPLFLTDPLPLSNSPAGWSYALRFRSRFWRGEAYTMRSFVRRRRWVRTRVYRPQHLPLLAAAASQQNALDSMGPPSPPAYDPTDERPLVDLHLACAALPLSSAQRAALLTESASPLSYTSNLIPPSNPFLSYRALKLDAASSGALPATERASAHEPRWRDAVRELNWRRASGVVRAHAKIDRQRLELWKLWLGARAAAAGEGGRRGSSEGARGSGAGAAAGARGAVRLEAAEGAGKGAGEAGRKAVSAAEGVAEEKERTEVWDDVGGHGGDKGPDVQDVWDVIEGRVRPLLPSAAASSTSSSRTDPALAPSPSLLARSSTRSSPRSTTSTPASSSSSSSSRCTRRTTPRTASPGTTCRTARRSGSSAASPTASPFSTASRSSSRITARREGGSGPRSTRSRARRRRAAGRSTWRRAGRARPRERGEPDRHSYPYTLLHRSLVDRASCRTPLSSLQRAREKLSRRGEESEERHAG